MIILGVDPGLQRTGYGLVRVEGEGRASFVGAGVIRTDPDAGISRRLDTIYTNLSEVTDEFRPEVLVLEKLYSHYRHPVTAILMGHARGIACLAASRAGLKLVSYSATKIKNSITGNGRAGKHQVQRMVKAILGLNTTPEPHDVSDALAIALSYVYIDGTGKDSLPGGDERRAVGIKAG